MSSTHPLHPLYPANQTRLARAAIKRRLRAEPSRSRSRALAAELLVETPAEIETMAVIDLLISCRQTGRSQARRLLQRAEIQDPLRQIGTLTPRQRKVLVALLGDHDETPASPSHRQISSR